MYEATEMRAAQIPTPAAPCVREELDELEASLAYLAEMTDRLASLLEPVLAAPTPQDVTATAKPMTSCFIGQRIADARDNVTAIRRRVADITDRVRL